MSEVTVDVRGSRILVVDDTPDNIRVLRLALEGEGYQVMFADAGQKALDLARRFPPGLILLDVTMPGMDGFEVGRQLRAEARTRAIPVIYLTARDTAEDVDEGFRTGGVDYIVKPFRKEEVLARVRTHLERGQMLQQIAANNAELEAQARQLAENNRALEEEIARRERLASERDELAGERNELADRLRQLSQRQEERHGVAGFIGRSPAVQAVLEEIELLRQAHSVPVLISGESGTGKEGVARAIHFGGKRTRGPFVAVNCAAIPDHLAESSFFGHARGAFTGAHDAHRGYFEQADGGTLFLDEIGDLPLDLQAKLLRTLETGTVTPLGATQERAVDVRIVAATNRDLPSMTAQDRFREDLYFRLAGFAVTLPPLRERREDIPLLVDHFLRQLSEEMGREQPGMSRDALEALEAHDFPGNVRELKNLTEYALIRSQGRPIRAEHLRFVGLRPSGTPPAPRKAAGDAGDDGGADAEERIEAHVRQHGSINNVECQRLLSVTHDRASYLLRKLSARGVLEMHGERRWARYRLKT